MNSSWNNMTKGLAFERDKFSILHSTHEIKYSDIHPLQ